MGRRGTTAFAEAGAGPHTLVVAVVAVAPRLER